MSSPADFALIPLAPEHRAAGEAKMVEVRGPSWREEAPFGWTGFAAEHAIEGACLARAELSPKMDCDLLIWAPPRCLRVEVKTRARSKGWTDPGRFDYVNVPTHDGREPIKAVDLVLFCWYAEEQPDRLWVLGAVRGPEEFQRRAQFYREGSPMPHGGEARKGGEWSIEIKQLRPLPRGLFQEIDR